MKTEKPQEDRIKETVNILRDLSGLGIPLKSPEVLTLKEKLDAYIKEGECWEGTLNFLQFGRMAEVKLPRRADQAIEVRLRLPRVGGK